MTRRIDDQSSAKFQASALNFNNTIKKSFGKRYGLNSKHALSIQFASISEDIARVLMAQADLPQHIQTYIVQYENGLTQAEYDDPRFSYRVAFVRKTSNAKSQPTRLSSSSQLVPTQAWRSTRCSSRRTKRITVRARS